MEGSNDEEFWVHFVFRFRHTVLENTWFLILAFFLYAWTVYHLEVQVGIETIGAGHTIFGAATSYLLVFRSNSAFQRFWQGKTMLTRLFLMMRELVMITSLTIQGGTATEAWRVERMSKFQRSKLEDGNDVRASLARVNFARFAVAFAVSIRLHTHFSMYGLVNGFLTPEHKWVVDWDRIRLRGLLTRFEFEDLNDLMPIRDEEHITHGAATLTSVFMEEALELPEQGKPYKVDVVPDIRQPLAILFRIKMEIIKHMNEPWGFRERFAPDMFRCCKEAAEIYDAINQMVTTPIPFPYVHLCKVLLVFFLLTTPLAIHPAAGFIANVVVPTAVAMSMLGIDAISTELENPFGDDSNDLDFGDLGVLEAECLRVLEMCGDHYARGSFFVYELPTPPVQDGLLGRAPKRFVCLKSQVEQDADSSAARPVNIGLRRNQRRSMRKGAGSTIDEEEDDDDPSRPLLSAIPGPGSGSQAEFIPLRDLSVQTVELATGPIGGKDFVGLSENEGSFMESSKLTGKNSITSSREGFRPMPEFGTQTIHLEEDGQYALGDKDVVGLSDDEASQTGTSPRNKFRPMPEFGSQTMILPQGGSAAQLGPDNEGLEDALGQVV